MTGKCSNFEHYGFYACEVHAHAKHAIPMPCPCLAMPSIFGIFEHPDPFMNLKEFKYPAKIVDWLRFEKFVLNCDFCYMDCRG